MLSALKKKNFDSDKFDDIWVTSKLHNHKQKEEREK